MEGNFLLKTQSDFDQLIQILTTMKGLVRPIRHAMDTAPETQQRPKPPEGSNPGPSGIPFMITQAQKDELRKLDYSDKDISEMKPERAHSILHQSRN